ncbi:MAG: ferritin-like domain-containing protein [Bacteroidetes bacterium]|nr:ferritin-like domain-containing protein [Bacteroidota bacterium]
MQTSQQWVSYFKENLEIKRINWQQPATITDAERKTILKSLQAWQLGETSDGKNLIRASSIYAEKIDDPYYIKAVQLFIKEEQKHGNNLGTYLDLIGEPRIKKEWGDSLFRKVRYLNTSMEWWTLAVIAVESTAQIFYQSLKDATKCNLLKEICTDILIDEVEHIRFQQERLSILFYSKNLFARKCSYYFYRHFFLATSILVWVAHKKVFSAGGNNFSKYLRKMKFKCNRTVGRLKPDDKEYVRSEKYDVRFL